jgi:hypothetical protein
LDSGVINSSIELTSFNLINEIPEALNNKIPFGGIIQTEVLWNSWKGQHIGGILSS